MSVRYWLNVESTVTNAIIVLIKVNNENSIKKNSNLLWTIV